MLPSVEPTPVVPPAVAEQPLWPPASLPSAYETVRAKAEEAAGLKAVPLPAAPGVKPAPVRRVRRAPSAPRGKRLKASPPAVLARHQARRGGRPTGATPERLEALAAALADPFNLTKAAAAKVAGVAFSTFMRWQLENPWLSDVWEDGRGNRWAVKRVQRRVRLARLPPRPRKPAPTKQMRLVQWFLVFRVHPEHALCPEHAQRACARVNLPWERWLEACERWPRLMESVRRKRWLRLCYMVEHGSIGLNDSVSHPSNPHRKNYPASAMDHWTRGKTFDDCFLHERAKSPRTGQRWL